VAERCLFKNQLSQKKSHESFIALVALVILTGAHKNLVFWTLLTSAVIGTGAGVGVDSVWEQKNSKPENACKSRRQTPQRPVYVLLPPLLR